MTFSVELESHNGTVTATLIGSPGVRAEGTTRDQALARIRGVIDERMRRGEIVVVDVPAPGILGLAGKYADDPSLREICEEAYKARDAESLE
jgi:hypothetical protein